MSLEGLVNKFKKLGEHNFPFLSAKPDVQAASSAFNAHYSRGIGSEDVLGTFAEASTLYLSAAGIGFKDEEMAVAQMKNMLGADNYTAVKEAIGIGDTVQVAYLFQQAYVGFAYSARVGGLSDRVEDLAPRLRESFNRAVAKLVNTQDYLKSLGDYLGAYRTQQAAQQTS